MPYTGTESDDAHADLKRLRMSEAVRPLFEHVKKFKERFVR